MKLSVKQKEVISEMKEGAIVHWIAGIAPYCFISLIHKQNNSVKISTATCLKLESLELIEREHREGNTKLYLTELGKTIQL